MSSRDGSNNPRCWSCGAQVSLLENSKVGFREDCDACSADLHCCVSCLHYDTSAYNECREPQAERVTEKERANSCEYHVYQSGTGRSDAKGSALKQLDDLFK